MIYITAIKNKRKFLYTTFGERHRYSLIVHHEFRFRTMIAEYDFIKKSLYDYLAQFFEDNNIQISEEKTQIVDYVIRQPHQLPGWVIDFACLNKSKVFEFMFPEEITLNYDSNDAR